MVAVCRYMLSRTSWYRWLSCSAAHSLITGGKVSEEEEFAW